jgi:integrase
MASLSLFSACNIWLAGKISKGLLPKTIECCQGNVRALQRFFGDMPLADFHAGSLKAYQIARGEGTGVFADEQTREPSPVGTSAINHELNVLQQMLRKAGLWDGIKDYYAPLHETQWQPPKTFTVKEEARIFEASANDPNVELADIVFRITRNTTASGCELRGLRLKNLELNARPPRVHIPPDATKNDIRPRVIPLNAEALEAFQRAVERAAKLGAHLPFHYLFPFRVNRRTWNPLRPASKSWLRKQTQQMRDKTGIEHLRPHAFRHLAVTELLEAGVPEQTVIALAGWVSRNMINTYSHTRIEAKADAVKVLTQKKPPQRATNVLAFPHSSEK